MADLQQFIIGSLKESLKKHSDSAVVMMELPEEQYFNSNLYSVKSLTDQGFEGVYVSFHRPFANLKSLLEKSRIDTSKLYFVDVATAFSHEEGECDEGMHCFRVSAGVEVDDLVRAVYTALSRLKSHKKFIFIDSLTTLTLYKPLSETMRFSDFLLQTIKREHQNVLLVFNVSKDLSQKKFIRDIALQVDDVIQVV